MGGQSVPGTNAHDEHIALAQQQAEIEKAKLNSQARIAEAESNKEQYKMYCDLESEKTKINAAAVAGINASAINMSKVYQNDWEESKSPKKAIIDY